MKYEEFFREYFSRKPRERMTIHELAERAGVSKNAVLNAKNGESMTTGNLEKLVNVLGHELSVTPKKSQDRPDVQG